MKGKIIVIEGLDGSGKSTQIEYLKNKLSGQNVCQIKLPDYDSDSSSLVKMYLRGDFGKKPEDVNAYAASAFYAVDRYANFKMKWKNNYDRAILLFPTVTQPPTLIIRQPRYPRRTEPNFSTGLRISNTVLWVFLSLTQLSSSICRSRYHRK